MITDVLILGGGIAGLSAAYRLQREGIQVRVLEKSAQVGGRARSFCVDGLCVDLSAQFLASFYTRTFALARSLGLAEEIIPITGGSAVVKGSQLYSLDLLPLLRQNLLPWTSKFRLFGLMLDVWRQSRLLIVDDIVRSVSLDTESVEAVAKRRLDATTLDYLIAPMLRGFFFWRAPSTSKAMLYFLLRYAATMKLFTLKSGIGAISHALARHVNVQTEREVVRAIYNQRLAIWETTISHNGRQEIIQAKSILCTLPAPSINSIFPELPPAVRDFFAGVTYDSNTTTHLFLDRRFPLPEFAHFFYPPRDVATIAGASVRSKKAPSETPPGKDVISLFPSSNFSQKLEHKSDEQITAAILSQLESLPPFAGQRLGDALLSSHVVRLQQALPLFDVGYIRRLQHFQEDLVKTLPPGLFFAGDFLETPSIEGAIVSGENVLPDLIKFIHAQEEPVKIPPTKKQKIAVLGGGMSALTAVFGLTSAPGWQDKYDVTVYQMGWRLGGKGASGRNQKLYNRIEEHGLHIWFGFYYNAFNLIQRCYQELNRPRSQPLATWEEAFKPLSINVLEENLNGDWVHWPIEFPVNDDTPGQGNGELLSLCEYVNMALQLIAGAFNESLYAQKTSHDPHLSGPIPNLLKVIVAELELAGLSVGAHLLSAAHRLATAPETYRHLLGDKHHHDTIADLLEHFVEWLAHAVERDIEQDRNARRLFVMLDFAVANIRGIIRDGVLTAGFEAIDHVDYRDWLVSHGLNKDITLKSAVMYYMYDLAFSYVNGDMRRPNFSAGVALHCLVRAFFTYKGAYMWKMQAGMGDTIFGPIYEVLKNRGVQFKFFHRVKELCLAEDGVTVDRIVIARQVNITGEQQKKGGYNPLFDVKGLPCWSSEPFYDQIVEGEALKGYDLESFWTGWQDVEEMTLQVEKDFNLIVLGIPLPALPFICPSIFKAKIAWQDMIANVLSMQTQAFQLWLKPDDAGLGWPLWRRERAILSEYDVEKDPYKAGLNTWSDMTQVLIRESWPDKYYPNNISYFCGPLLDEGLDKLPPPGDHDFPDQQAERVKQNTIDLLNKYIGGLWPAAVKAMATHPGGFNWELLVDPADEKEEARFSSQFWRANVDPSERYVLSVPGSTQYRLKTDESGCHNLYLTGDWINNGLNVGCIESAVMSGMLTAQAITQKLLGQPTPPGVVGGPGWWMRSHVLDDC